MLGLLYISTFSFAAYASANLAYKSRPDLAVPVLNITIPATSDAADGLIFTPQRAPLRIIPTTDLLKVARIFSPIRVN